MLPGKQYGAGDVLAMLSRRWWILVVGLILGTYAALVVASRIIDVYQSEMLIQVVPQRVPDAYVRSTVTMRTEDRLTALAEQVKSRTELERLITQLNLYAPERARLPMQDVVELMRGQIQVEPVLRTQGFVRDAEAFHVRFAYPDADIVTRVTERLGALFIEVNARDRGNLAESTNNFLQAQLADARRRLEEQERKLERFRQQNSGRLPTELQANMQGMQSAQMALQAAIESVARDGDRKLMLERLYLDSQNERAQPAPAPQPVVAQAPPAAAANVPGGTTEQQLAGAREALGRLELRLKPEHPDVARTRRIVADLEARLAEETRIRSEREASAKAAGAPAPPTVQTPDQIAKRQRLEQMSAEIESLNRQVQFKQAQEERLSKNLADYQRRIEQVPGLESEWTVLTRDYDTMQAAYKELLAKSEDARLATELETRQIGEQFRILDPARRPMRPVGVNRLQINAVGAAIGLALGVALAGFLELRSTAFRTSADVLAALNLPVVALVPCLVSAADRRRRRLQQVAVSVGAMVVTVAGGYVFWKLELWKHIT